MVIVDSYWTGGGRCVSETGGLRVKRSEGEMGIKRGVTICISEFVHRCIVLLYTC